MNLSGNLLKLYAIFRILLTSLNIFKEIRDKSIDIHWCAFVINDRNV